MHSDSLAKKYVRMIYDGKGYFHTREARDYVP